MAGPIVRDLQAAEDVGSRARLGWFDVEFNFYGTAWREHDEMNYLISANPVKIYDFAMDKLAEDIYCAPVETYRKKCSVPSGTEDCMAMNLKILQGRTLRNRYPEAFLLEFHDAFATAANDAGKVLLDGWQEELDGLFEEEPLNLFEMFVDHAYTIKNLTKPVYTDYKQWLKDVHSDMDDDIIVKDIYYKTLFSLRYTDNGCQKTAINAQKDRLYNKRYMLMKRGIRPTIIYGKTYWYNTDYRLSDCRADYETYLASDIMENFNYDVDSINRLPSAVDHDTYWQRAEQWIGKYGEGIKAYLDYYAVMWGCGLK